ncbi:MAG: hypothetical protein IAF38_16205 [Bacteroidia bacterium]|nr:hypothetical protein [Bacteroidia bacterium]
MRKSISSILPALFVCGTIIAQNGNNWTVNGNNTSNGNFVGTLNNNPLIFKVNNQNAGRFKPNGNFLLNNFQGANSGLVYSNQSGELFKLDFSNNGQVLFDNGSWGDLPTSPQFWTTAGNPNDMYNKTLGFVGIGTTSPAFNLDVNGDARVNGKLINQAWQGSTNRILLTDAGGSVSPLGVGNSTDVLYGNGTWGPMPASLWSVDPASGEMYNTSTAGTNINGNARFGGNITATTLAGTGDRSVYVDAGGNLKVGPVLPLPGGGACNPGVPDWALGGNTLSTYILPPGGDAAIGTCDNVDFVLKANNQPSVHIESSAGNFVGIGTSTPVSKLDVNGTQNVTGEARFLNRIYAGQAKVLQVATINAYNNSGAGGLWVKTDHSTNNNSYNSVFEINNVTTKALSVVNTNFPASTSLGFKELFTVFGNGDVATEGIVSVINPVAGPSGRIYAGKGLSVKGAGILNSYDNSGNLGLWIESSVTNPNSYNAVFAASHNDAKSITVLDLNTLTSLAPFNYKSTFSVLCDGRTQINTRSTNFIEALSIGRELTPNNFDKNIVLYNNGAGHFSSCVQIGFPNGSIPSVNEALNIDAGTKTGIISKTTQTVIGGYNVHIQVNKNLTKALAVQNSEGGFAETFLVYGDGSTGIGTNFIPPGFKLAVASGIKINMNTSVSGSTAPSAIEVTDLTGTNFKVKSSGFVYARSIEVTLANFPDYVFSNTYKLMPLTDVETYIKKNHHLPNVPTAEEVEKNGANLGELCKTQMEKIEELTLYLIELKKEMEELKKQVNKQ